MDTNILSIIAAMQQLQGVKSDPISSNTILYAVLGLITAFVAWNSRRMEQVHKSVNSTATQLASEKRSDDLVATAKTTEIATLKEKLSDKSLPNSTSGFTAEQLEQIRQLVQASK